MLIEFSVGNYRSFMDAVTLSMQAAKLKASRKEVNENNVFYSGKLDLLRSAAIYGPNASGKSNLIQAMNFMRRFTMDSAKESQSGDRIDVERFRLSTVTQELPAYFQIVFQLDGKRYRYGFELDEDRVHTEWLYHAGHRETRLFIREGDRFDLSSVFKEGHGLEKHTRDNALFLSLVAQLNGPLSIKLLDWFRTKFNIISGLEDHAYSGFTLSNFDSDVSFRKQVVSFVHEADLGIADIEVDRLPITDDSVPEEVRDAIQQFIEAEKRRIDRSTELDSTEVWVNRIRTIHKTFDQNSVSVSTESFDMETQESEGTKKLFLLSGPLFDTLNKGKVLIIDEMEARLHPTITRAIINLFNSTKTNPRNAQLIFATHDTCMLSNKIFRRDQIWFTEKDRYGATDLYSLAELKVRNDASFDKDYIAGRYGAIPFIGGLSVLFEELGDGAKA